MRRADDPCNGLIHAMRISICYDTAPSSFNAIFFDYFGYWIKPIHLRGEIVFLPMIFPRPRAALSPRASTQRRDMTTRPSTVTELAAVTFTDAQRKESPTPMSAQRAYSRAAESIALDSRDAYCFLSFLVYLYGALSLPLYWIGVHLPSTLFDLWVLIIQTLGGSAVIYCILKARNDFERKLCLDSCMLSSLSLCLLSNQPYICLSDFVARLVRRTGQGRELEP